MSRFTSLLKVSPLPDGRSWVLLEPLTYEVGELGSADVITVPRGFVTDFASVPRVLWNILPPTGGYGEAAVIHDYLYRTPGKATKRQADAVLLEAMKQKGVDWLARWIIYLGVRIGGGWSYKGGL